MKARKPKSTGGRPTRFRPEFIEQAEKLCKLGAIDKELAEFFGVSEATLNTWKKEFPEFLESLKAGKAKADDQIERSLFHRARGYSHPATKLFYDARRGEVVRAEYTERFPPDPTSMIYWLKNRRPDRWRDHRDEVPEDPAVVARATRDLVLALFKTDPPSQS